MRWSWMLLGFSSLSFLGFGVSPPTPDWGLMISNARGLMSFAYWSVIAPIVGLSSLIIGINLTADAFAKASIGTSKDLIEGLKKLTVTNLGNLTPHQLTVWLSYSHPPVISRIKVLNSSKK